MAKDKRIGELSGITASAVVGLNRAGIVSLHDLLAADFDRVAYVVDDYNEAARLVKEARKLTEGRRPGKQNESLVPTTFSGARDPSSTRMHTRSSGASTPPVPHAAPAHAPEPVVAAPAFTGDDTEGTAAGAMALAMRGLSINGSEGAEARAILARRFDIASLILSGGGSEAEIAAAVLLDAAEAGTVSPDDVANRCGSPIETLIEECASLRAVPMLPTGKTPRYYLEMAKGASREARRVCAVHLMLAARTGGAGLPGGQWYARLLAEALEAGGPDELVTQARSAVESMKKAA